MTTRDRQRAAEGTRRAIPDALADVALIDGRAAGATGGMSLSWWQAEVAAGRAPAPAVRRSRCTRWRVADVREFWTRWTEQAQAECGDAVVERARKASMRAREAVAARAAAKVGAQ